ncbi:hypothetical protein GOP47_0016437 [Adiantum capillus-veneris]|uniref:HhH-GPD domain-containing protein n=1 Tax=Adiantum capillus-veneris TaxID=13818 RepID=A0A9D4ZBR1_ADICA|nr:hypothetical protein GOP47_0016437 [Adiantum capillus-veneris]
MVEVYKWGGNAPKTFASRSEPLTLPDGEEESAGSGCTGSYSSPSPSLPQSMGHAGTIQTMKTDGGSGDMPNRALSLAPGWHKPCRRQKKQRSFQRSSTRQLVFSVEDMDAKGTAKRTMKPKKTIKKNQCKRRKVELKQDGSQLISQVQSCNLPDFYDDSECENGLPFTQEFYSPGISCSPGQHSPSKLAAWREEEGDTQRARNRDTHGKSPYFMSSQRNAKVKGANKDKRRTTKKSERSSAQMKPCTQKWRKEDSVAKVKADITEIKHLPGGGSECVDLEDCGEHSAHSSKQPLNPFDSGVLCSKATSRTKKSSYFEATVKALGQRHIVNKTWVPPISVHALIQEELYKEPWKVLVACMLLNKTSGKQMRKIIWDLFDLCPTPEAAVEVETSKIEDVIRGLGLQNKRARMIQKFSKDYLGKDWTNVGQLHGIGKYATDAYAIFCEGRWQEVKPEDHKLVDYWKYLCATEGLGYAFKDDREKGHELQTSVEINFRGAASRDIFSAMKLDQ